MENEREMNVRGRERMADPIYEPQTVDEYMSCIDYYHTFGDMNYAKELSDMLKSDYGVYYAPWEV